MIIVMKLMGKECSYKPQQLTMQEEGQVQEKGSSMPNDGEESAIYSGIHKKTLDQIKNIDLDGSYGTKIDTIARYVRTSFKDSIF